MKDRYKNKYSTLKNVTYCDIIRGRKTLRRYEGAEVEGLTWKAFQEKVGKDVGAGAFTFSVYFKNGEKYPGRTKAIDIDNMPSSKDTTESDSESKNILSAIKSLNDSISKKSEGNLSTDMLIQFTKQGYENQLQFKEFQITDLKAAISKLTSANTDLESELDECNDAANEFQNQNSWVGIFNQYKPMIEAGLSRLGIKQNTQIKLSSSDQSDIPGEILQILGTVDWIKVQNESPETYNQILSYLRSFIPKLPQKQ